MATTEYGKWSTAMDTAPSAGHGVDIEWHGEDSGYDMVVQVAPITSTNLSGATQPVWFDITARVIDCAWDDGDPDLESRWPVNSAVVRCTDISDIVGDPMGLWSDRNEVFGTQSLIRFGLRSPGGAYRGLFAGVIDTVTEEWSADTPVRVFDMQCFDVGYLVAGYRGVALPGYSLTSVELGVMALLTGVNFPFTRTMYGIPADWWTTQVETDPTTTPLNMIHRILDSGGALLHASGAGMLEMFPWDYSTQAGAVDFTVVDGYYWVDPDPAYAVPTFARTITAPFMRWVNSVDRMAFDVQMTTSKIPGGSYSNSVFPLSLKFRGRNDRPGWPKLDLLNSNPAQLPDLNAATVRFSDPRRLDLFTIDTQTVDRAAPLALGTVLDFLSFACQPGRWYNVQRRGRGVDGWWSQIMSTQYAEHYLTRAQNQWRWTCTVHPRWAPFYEAP